MVAGPEVSHLSTEYEIVSEAKVRMKRSDTSGQLQFFEKVGKLYRVMKKMVNPFQEETADLLTLDTKIITTPYAGEMVMGHYQSGESCCKAFIGSLDKGDEDSFYDPIKKNKLDFFQNQPEQAAGDLKQTI